MIETRGFVTATRAKTADEGEIRRFAEDLGLSYIPRENRSLDTLKSEHAADWIIVWEPEGPVLIRDGTRFFYHPSMAKNRIAGIRQGREDLMIKAMGLGSGMSVLDCTLGLGADALVAAYIAGPEGEVTGLEGSRVVAGIVRWGAKLYRKGPGWLQDVIPRLQVIWSDHLAYLKLLPDRAFDIVYFDPMFRQPIHESNAIAPVRGLARPEAVTPEAIREAARVARRRVVMKERCGSSEFERLGFQQVTAGTQSLIAYGTQEV
ncbi:MAG: class I SAM-dependent methyltransferase [Solirubrobacterales bacterium]